MPLYQRIGLSAESIAKARRMERVASTMAITPEPKNVWSHLLSILERESDAALACYLEDDTNEARPASFAALIYRGRSKRHKLLSDILAAIAMGKSKEAQAAIESYLVWYRKTEFPRPGLEEKLSIDGSTLVHLARHRGLAI